MGAKLPKGICKVCQQEIKKTLDINLEEVLLNIYFFKADLQTDAS